MDVQLAAGVNRPNSKTRRAGTQGYILINMSARSISLTVGIVSIGSGIGRFLARNYVLSGARVVGTLRNGGSRPGLTGATTHILNLEAGHDWDSAVKSFVSDLNDFDILIFANGVMDPIGPLLQLRTIELEENFRVNFFSTLSVLSSALSHRGDSSKNRTVVFFSGGGTNSTNDNFGAYTLSKIALLKATELLASENPAIQFVCIGPGWVRTRIHEQAVSSEKTPEAVNSEYKRRLRDNDFRDPEEIFKAINHVHDSFPVFSGRNISTASDDFTSVGYLERVRRDAEFLMLRRKGNVFANGGIDESS